MEKTNFIINIDDVTYSNDVFLEKLRNELNNVNIKTLKSKEKTGHASSLGVGMGLGGGVGLGGATTDIITHQWNPFEIVCPADKFNFFGKFKGELKISELSSYQKKIKRKNVNFKNYEIYGGLSYKPNIFLAIVVGFLASIIFSILDPSLGFLAGLFGAIVYYFVIRSLAVKEVNHPITLIESSINIYQKEIKDYIKKM